MTGSNGPFCRLAAARTLFADQVTLVIRDAFPVSPGHTPIIPRCHVGFLPRQARMDPKREALEWRLAMLDR